MQMRRLDTQWLDAMEGYVTSTIKYFTDNKLFAYQGGPIVAAQIENELGEDQDDDLVDETPHTGAGPRKPSVQEYADWCGALVERLAPKVVWTMCYGLSASNTIVTCNGACTTWWIEQHGTSGRIQVDQPAMYSEGKFTVVVVQKATPLFLNVFAI